MALNDPPHPHIEFHTGGWVGPFNPPPLEDPRYNCLDDTTLQKVATILKGLESIEASLAELGGLGVWLNSPILVQGEGYRVGWIKPVDDFWVFVPDPKDDDD